MTEVMFFNDSRCPRVRSLRLDVQLRGLRLGFGCDDLRWGRTPRCWAGQKSERASLHNGPIINSLKDVLHRPNTAVSSSLGKHCSREPPYEALLRTFGNRRQPSSTLGRHCQRPKSFAAP